MIDYDVDVLKSILDDQKRFLRDGVTSSDIWDRRTGLSICGMNPAEELTALFNRLMDEIDSTLLNSGFPELNRYLMVNLEGTGLILVINYGDNLIQSMVLDPKKVNLGILFNVIVPKSIEKINQASS